MTSHALILAALSIVLPDLPPHDRNAVLHAATAEGIASGDVHAKLPEPIFGDGQSADEQKATLAKVAGSSRGAEEMLQPSLSAPHKLSTNDVKARDATIRTADLTFVLRGIELNDIKPDEAFRQFRGESIEAANMKVKVQLLTADEVKEATTIAAAGNEWLAHSTGRLLDRISVESTDRIVATRTADSLIFATRTDPAFGPKTSFPNRWSTITLKSTGDVFGPAEAYAGGIGYVKMTRLKGQDKAVVVEAHLAYVEPQAWFRGEPILRSKFGLIAQDQVRRMRRELAKPKR